MAEKAEHDVAEPRHADRVTFTELAASIGASVIGSFFAAIAVNMSRKGVVNVHIPYANEFHYYEFELLSAMSAHRSVAPWIIAASLIGLVIFLIFMSRARFFIAGMSVISSEVGLRLFDVFRIDSAFAGDSFLKVEAIRSTEPIVHIAIIGLAAFCFWIDHQRRPAR